MDSLNKLIHICNSYKNGEYDINEFKARIESSFLPDEYKDNLEKEQYNACNRLEEIVFCFLDSNRKEHADRVANDLIRAIEKIQRS